LADEISIQPGVIGVAIYIIRTYRAGYNCTYHHLSHIEGCAGKPIEEFEVGVVRGIVKAGS